MQLECTKFLGKPHFYGGLEMTVVYFYSDYTRRLLQYSVTYLNLDAHFNDVLPGPQIFITWNCVKNYGLK